MHGEMHRLTHARRIARAAHVDQDEECCAYPPELGTSSREKLLNR
jgi:hypothetical protein